MFSRNLTINNSSVGLVLVNGWHWEVIVGAEGRVVIIRGRDDDFRFQRSTRKVDNVSSTLACEGLEVDLVFDVVDKLVGFCGEVNNDLLWLSNDDGCWVDLLHVVVLDCESESCYKLFNVGRNSESKLSTTITGWNVLVGNWEIWNPKVHN